MERIANIAPVWLPNCVEMAMSENGNPIYEQGRPLSAWPPMRKDSGDWVYGPATAARADPCFPENDDPGKSYAYLSAQKADGDTFQTIRDAESDWQSGR
jgi:hypothetical protein